MASEDDDSAEELTAQPESGFAVSTVKTDLTLVLLVPTRWLKTSPTLQEAAAASAPSSKLAPTT